VTNNTAPLKLFSKPSSHSIDAKSRWPEKV
jgi:hypothetical protein